MEAPDKQKRHYVEGVAKYWQHSERQWFVTVLCRYGHLSRFDEARLVELRCKTFDNGAKAQEFKDSLSEQIRNIHRTKNRPATLADLFGECDESKVVTYDEDVA